MKEVKHILTLIYRFLTHKESEGDKRELLDWYQDSETGYEPTAEHIERTGQAVKRQVFHSIQDQDNAIPIRRLWPPVAVAASLVLLAGFGYWYSTRETVTIADAQLLSNISPSGPQAKITLENGQIIDLESMAIDSCIRLGNIEIIKDSTGQISYVQNTRNTQALGTNTIETPASANYTLNLSDGTVVLLNTNTKLKYPNSFGTGDRIVQLEGEAYFIVSKTTHKQKFIVKTQRQSTEVLGTKFNVKARSGQLAEYTTLEEGLIQVTNTNTSDIQLVQPGQQAEFNRLNTKIQQVDLEPSLAWTKGYFYMNGQNTAEVLQEIAEWYDIDINYTENKTTYKGKIPKNLKLNKLIQLLEYTNLKTKPTVENDRIKLLIK